MGALLATLITRLRTDLQDSGAATWSDAELTSHIDRAVREYSRVRPRERRSTLATTASSREINISSLTDPFTITAVEWPIDEFPRLYRRFSHWNDVLELLDQDLPDGTNAKIYWTTGHTVDGSASTIPPLHDDVILLGAGAYALLDQATATTNTVNLGGADTDRQYQSAGLDRHNRFLGELARLRRAIKTTTLYVPANPTASQSTDPGP